MRRLVRLWAVAALLNYLVVPMTALADVSNVALLCPKGHPTRVGYKTDAEGNCTP